MMSSPKSRHRFKITKETALTRCLVILDAHARAAARRERNEENETLRKKKIKQDVFEAESDAQQKLTFFEIQEKTDAKHLELEEKKMDVFMKQMESSLKNTEKILEMLAAVIPQRSKGVLLSSYIQLE